MTSLKNRKYGKLLLCFCIIFCVAFPVFILPILIWSPPWSIHRVYIRTDDSLPENCISYASFDDQTLFEVGYFTHEKENIFTNIIHFPNKNKKRFYSKKHLIEELQWEIHFELTPKNKQLHLLERVHNLKTKEKHIPSPLVYSPISNPFTIWHMKYLEWSHKGTIFYSR